MCVKWKQIQSSRRFIIPFLQEVKARANFTFFLATNYFKNIWHTFIVFEDTKMPFELKCSHELLEVKAGAYYDFGER